jgi:esterase/lipase
MVVSIASMLASVFPVGKVATLATKMAQATSKAVMKALLKQFAKEIGEF